MAKYSKTLIMIGASVASVLFASFHGDANISPAEWLNVIIALAGACTVYLVPNLNVTAAKYAKGAVAFVVAGVSTLHTLLADGITMTEWWQVVIAALGAVGVVLAPGPIWDAVSRTSMGVRSDELRP